MRGVFRTGGFAALRAVIAVALAAIALHLVAADALASHVRCGDVITHDATLDGDLVGCPGNGIEIGAPNITLDLAGHTISGQAGSGSVGVLDVGDDGATVANGTVEQFGYGVYLYGVDGALVRGLDVRDDGNGIVLSGQPTSNLVEQNVVTGFGRGFQVGTGITVDEGTWSGGQTYRPAANRVEHNTVEGRELSGAGISVVAADANQISTNDVSIHSYAPGISVAGFYSPDPSGANSSVGNRVEQNEVSGAGFLEGVVMASLANDNVVEANDISNFFDGISNPSFADDNLVARNRVTGSIETGILVGYGDYDVHGIRVIGNRVAGSGVDGIAVSHAALVATLERNRSVSNDDDGIDVDAAGTRIASNWVKANADWGIEGVPGVLDDRHNRAWRNGQPDQCLYVRCRLTG
jgi:hypothetical protein